MKITPIARLAVASFFICLSPVQGGTSPVDPDKDPKLVALLQEGQSLAGSGKPAQAVKKCDQIINAFRRHYKDKTEKIYCARSSTETLACLVKAAAVDNRSAIALSSTWANALYVKAYALQELNRLVEAKKCLQQALDLSPFNSAYKSELGNIYQIEKDWAAAKQLFRDAEEHAVFSPEESEKSDRARARRGFGYCLVEEGKLDEAEDIYLRCLEADPNDSRASAELAYVRNLRAKTN